MVHAGVTQINYFLIAINIPLTSATGLLKRQKEVGPGVHKVAKKKCMDYALAEKSMEAAARNI